jgi:hypothetical protein
MVNLNSNLTFPNINRWEVEDFGPNKGNVVVLFWAPNSTQPFPPSIRKQGKLSNAAGKSSGFAVNAAPEHWNDKIIEVAPTPSGVGGVGLAGALTAAQDAYRAAANHNAGLRAVEGVLMSHDIVSSALDGT